MSLAVATFGDQDVSGKPWDEQAEYWMGRIKFAKGVHAVSKLALGQALYHLKTTQYVDGGLHFLFQSQYDKWGDFLASPEVDIAPSTARNLIAIWRWAESHDIKPEDVIEIGHRKMSLIMPALREGDTAWLDDARLLTTGDLKAKLNAARGQEDEWEYKRLYCPQCDSGLSCARCGWST